MDFKDIAELKNETSAEPYVLFFGAPVSYSSGLPGVADVKKFLFENLASKIKPGELRVFFEMLNRVLFGITMGEYVELSEVLNARYQELKPIINYEFTPRKLRLMKHVYDSLRMERLFQVIIDSKGDGAGIDDDYISNLFRVLGSSKPPNKFHKAIAGRMDKGTISFCITTNFDDMLERTNRSVKPYYSKDDIIKIIERPEPPENLSLLKIHGSLQDCSSMVIAINQFLNYEDILEEFFKKIFRNHRVVFLSYGFNDWDVNYALNKITEARGINVCLFNKHLTRTELLKEARRVKAVFKTRAVNVYFGSQEEYFGVEEKRVPWEAAFPEIGEVGALYLLSKFWWVLGLKPVVALGCSKISNKGINSYLKGRKYFLIGYMCRLSSLLWKARLYYLRSFGVAVVNLVKNDSERARLETINVVEFIIKNEAQSGRFLLGVLGSNLSIYLYKYFIREKCSEKTFSVYNHLYVLYRRIFEYWGFFKVFSLTDDPSYSATPKLNYYRRKMGMTYRNIPEGSRTFGMRIRLEKIAEKETPRSISREIAIANYIYNPDDFQNRYERLGRARQAAFGKRGRMTKFGKRSDIKLKVPRELRDPFFISLKYSRYTPEPLAEVKALKGISNYYFFRGDFKKSFKTALTAFKLTFNKHRMNGFTPLALFALRLSIWKKLISYISCRFVRSVYHP